MDDRPARDREDANGQQRVPASRQADGPSPNGRANEESPADRRSSSAKPALTQRERDELWPLG